MSEDGVVFVFIDVVDSDVSNQATDQSMGLEVLVKSYTPLKIIWSGVFMLLIGTERTDVAWGIMHQAMAHHLILALESFPTYATLTAFYGTEMRSILRMHVCMRAVVP